MPSYTTPNNLSKEFRLSDVICYSLKLTERAVFSHLCSPLLSLMIHFSLHAGRTGVSWMQSPHVGILFLKVWTAVDSVGHIFLSCYLAFDFVPVLSSSIGLSLLDVPFPNCRGRKATIRADHNEPKLVITYPVSFLIILVFFNELIFRLFFSLPTSATCELIHRLNFLRMWTMYSVSQFPTSWISYFSGNFCNIQILTSQSACHSQTGWYLFV